MLASAFWAAKADVAVTGIHTDTAVAILKHASLMRDGKLLQECDGAHVLAAATPLHVVEAKRCTTKHQEHRGALVWKCARGGEGGGALRCSRERS